MILTTNQSLLIIIAVAITTFLTRVIPFILFPENKETPPYIAYLGRVLPYSAIGMLVIYCFKEVSIQTAPFGLPELIASGVIIILHKWKHNTLLSIGGGTVVYMMLIQTGFFI